MTLLAEAQPAEDLHPWRRWEVEFSLELRRALADHDVQTAIPVRTLGLQNELAKPDDPLDPGIAVFLAGDEVLVWAPGSECEGCAQCLARRWQLLRAMSVRDALETGIDTVAVGSPVVFMTVVASTVAAAVVAAQENYSSDNVVVSVSVRNHRVQRVRCAPDPACPVSGLAALEPALVTLADLPTTRRLSPDSPHARPLLDIPLDDDVLVNPVCGVIGYGFLHVFNLPSTAAVHGSFATRTDGQTYEVRWGGHANSFNASRRIGLLEGLERHAGTSPRARRPPLVDTLARLRSRGMTVLDPRECGEYSQEFYEYSEAFRPFTQDLPIAWVQAQSLVSDSPILVAEDSAFYAVEGAGELQRFVLECSNGCATGSNLTEAVLGGLMEVIERDAFLLAWYGRLSAPLLDGTSSKLLNTRLMLRRLTMLGFEARFVDLSFTFGIPVVIAVARRTDGRAGICVGGGCSMTVEGALAAALDEIATDAATLVERTERDKKRFDLFASDYDEVTSIHDHSGMFGLPEVGSLADFFTAGDGNDPRCVTEAQAAAGITPTDDLRSDLLACVERLAAEQYDVIVVDQTSTEEVASGLRTVAVIVPGLLPIDFGWARQRALRMPRLVEGVRAFLGSDSDIQLNLVPHPYP